MHSYRRASLDFVGGDVEEDLLNGVALRDKRDETLVVVKRELRDVELAQDFQYLKGNLLIAVAVKRTVSYFGAKRCPVGQKWVTKEVHSPARGGVPSFPKLWI